MAIWREIEGWTYEFFDRDIEPNLVPVFETIRHGLCRDIHAHSHTFDLVLFNPGFECGLGKAYDT